MIAGDFESTDCAAHRDAWRAAQDFDALLVLGAAFLDRRCAHFPGWGATTPDRETDAICAQLLELNAIGFLSVASQPGFEGRRDGRDVRQRAFVLGFARPDLARRWSASRTIAVRSFDGRSAEPATPEEPMTLEDGVARVVAGHAARDAELALFEDEVGPGALDALREATFVAAWDPSFGREHVLWEELLRLGRD